MRTLVPDFFDDFYCKAGACKTTCCQKWEIDIDEATAERYMDIPGELGKKLKTSMGRNEDSYYFKLNEKGFCHFFREDGLCQLIMEMGEDCLCDICAEHPRFYELFEDEEGEIELGGVGLCCEKSCELLLEDTYPLGFYMDGVEDTLSLEDVCKHFGFDIPSCGFSFVPQMDESYTVQLLEYMAATEPIDEVWTKHMLELKASPKKAHMAFLEAWEKIDKGLVHRIYQYILFRHLEKLEEWTSSVVLSYTALNTQFVLMEAGLTDNLPESLRRWSEQIEYDTDNVDLLLDFLRKN